jgi:hypothetical protein
MESVVDQIMAAADEDYESRGRRSKRTRGRSEGEDGTVNKEGELRFPPKRVGEIGELEFIQKAIRKGFLVSKPWGDSDRYDAVTDWKGRLQRVQVRATERRMGARGFAVHASVYAGKKIVGLTKKDIDVLAAYIFPKDLWYIVPVEKFVPRKNLWFYPDGSIKGAKFEKFREAWAWLKGKRKARRR